MAKFVVQNLWEISQEKNQALNSLLIENERLKKNMKEVNLKF